MNLDELDENEEQPSTKMPPAQPFAEQDDLDWLKNINDQQNVPPVPASPVSPFVPRRTAPLEETTETAFPIGSKARRKNRHAGSRRSFHGLV